MNLLAGINYDRDTGSITPRIVHQPGGKWVFTGRHQPRPVPGGLLAIKPVYRWQAKCPCWRCAGAAGILLGMVVCAECGNKRCPRATDHAHACIGSNEPGQPGSRY